MESNIFSKKEREAYQQSLKYLRDLHNVVNTAHKEGEQIGLEKGEQIGLKKGAIHMAITMKKDGMPIDQIVKYTGLSEKEIERLKT